MDGKVKGKSKASSSSQQQQQQTSTSQQAPGDAPVRGIPNYDYKKGKLTFAKAKSLNTNPEEPMVSVLSLYSWIVLEHSFPKLYDYCTGG